MNQSNKGNAVVGIVVVIGILLLLFLLYKGTGSSNQITDYSRLCNDAKVLEQKVGSLTQAQAVAECTQWNDLTADTYTVNVNTQSVIDGVDLQEMPKPCVVADAQNWSCASGGVGFRDGKYFITDGDLLPTEHFGVLTYWWYKLTGWI